MAYLVVLSIFSQFDFLILSRMFDSTDLAEIIVLQRLVSIPAIFVTAANSVIFPFIQKDTKSIETKKMIVFTTALSVLVSAIGMFLLPFFIKGTSSTTGIYFGIIVLFTILGTLNIERANRLLSNGFHKILALYFLASLVIKALIIFIGFSSNLSAIVILSLSLPAGLIVFNFLTWKLHETKYSFS